MKKMVAAPAAELVVPASNAAMALSMLTVQQI